jgi:hypothetical protein
LPLKVDEAATVKDARVEDFDYFVSDSDTSHGASGGPALDSRLAVLGVLARGGADGSLSAEECFESAHEPASDDPQEHFTYAGQALRALCDTRSSSTLCRAECQDPCESLSPPRANEATGCSTSGHGRSSSAPVAVLACMAIVSVVRLAHRLRPRCDVPRCRGGSAKRARLLSAVSGRRCSAPDRSAD